MRQLSGLVLLLISIPISASAVLLLAPSGESVTIQCRPEGLYLAYQIDGLEVCSELTCLDIDARVDDGGWSTYAAHNGINSGFVRNRKSTVRMHGADAEGLLKLMVNASAVSFRDRRTNLIASFPITEDQREELRQIASECG